MWPVQIQPIPRTKTIKTSTVHSLLRPANHGYNNSMRNMAVLMMSTVDRETTEYPRPPQHRQEAEMKKLNAKCRILTALLQVGRRFSISGLNIRIGLQMVTLPLAFNQWELCHRSRKNGIRAHQHYRSKDSNTITNRKILARGRSLDNMIRNRNKAASPRALSLNYLLRTSHSNHMRVSTSQNREDITTCHKSYQDLQYSRLLQESSDHEDLWMTQGRCLIIKVLHIKSALIKMVADQEGPIRNSKDQT